MKEWGSIRLVQQGVGSCFSDGQEVDMSENERCITFPNGSWRLTNSTHNDVVLVVDDDPGVLKSVSSLLAEHYTVIACPSAGEAFKYASNGKISVVLSDVKMPMVSGIELLDHMRSLLPDVPVILMTAYAEIDTALSALKKKAFDLIIKPFDPDLLMEVLARAIASRRSAVREREQRFVLQDAVREKSVELAKALEQVKGMSFEVVERLTAAAECRDTDTGEHIIRIGKYAGHVARRLNLDDDFIENIMFASQMHDIGKIGIPDNILLKPGGLTQEEFAIMKNHTLIGERILRGPTSPVLKMAASIAISHHERWDGGGYPHGLKEENIPLEGRIVFLCDQYDALRSRRPYKEPLSHERVREIILAGDGRSMPEYFDPGVLEVFRETHAKFDLIFERYQ